MSQDKFRQISTINGDYSFLISGTPASIQSPRQIKQQYQQRIHDEIVGCRNIFSREVEAKIIWYTDYKKRYTTDSSFDIDNIVKPTLDALVGINGLVFDDCQVQSIICHWIDKNEDQEDYVEITLRTLENNGEHVVKKDDVCFFQLEGPIYYLFLCHNMSGILAREMYSHYQSVIKRINELIVRGVNPDEADYLWPVMATKYHISRISRSGFPCYKKDEIPTFLNSLQS